MCTTRFCQTSQAMTLRCARSSCNCMVGVRKVWAHQAPNVFLCHFTLGCSPNCVHACMNPCVRLDVEGRRAQVQQQRVPLIAYKQGTWCANKSMQLRHKTYVKHVIDGTCERPPHSPSAHTYKKGIGFSTFPVPSVCRMAMAGAQCWSNSSSSSSHRSLPPSPIRPGPPQQQQQQLHRCTSHTKARTQPAQLQGRLGDPRLRR